VGSNQDSIFPVHINGGVAQLGSGIPFPSENFTDMASCQGMQIPTSVSGYPNQEIKIFPNPSNGYVSLPTDMDKSNVVVYNSTGQIVSYKLNGNILNLSNHPPGLYYLKINNDVWPIIIQY
jgi:hypothetical protein